MNIFKHKNISKTIAFTSILIILLNSLLISLFYFNNEMNEYNKKIELLVKNSIQKQKQSLKKDVDNIIQNVDFWYKNINNKQDLKQKLVKLIGNIDFDDKKENYIFVYELHNINGGNKFAKLLINPNRPDLIGKFISDEYKDKNGKQFRKEFLKDIKQKGESFVEYVYKKLSTNNIVSKISYLKYYKKLNWIIAKGAYKDTLQIQLKKQKFILKNKVRKQIIFNIFSFLIISMFAILVSFIISKKIKNVLESKQKEVKKKTIELKILNDNLKKKASKEVQKAYDQEQILMQKSKFISMGEMISNIAHQWRQPISELSSIFMNIQLRYDTKKLDNNFMTQKTQEIEHILEYMSNTIDDFRSFFKPNKKKTKFKISKMINSAIGIIGSTLKNNNIKVVFNIDENLEIYNLENELEQVVLNIITNAKDVLASNKVTNPKIIINAIKESKNIKISILDNGGGIQNELLDKIFEPYFTTKDDTQGTGLGLYMAKIICEKNMNAKINVTNIDKGVKFCIILPL
jgi:signal transduction histidine kinase